MNASASGGDPARRSLGFDFSDPEHGLFGVISVQLGPGDQAAALAVVFDHDRPALRTVERSEAAGSPDPGSARVGAVSLGDAGGGRARAALSTGDGSLELLFAATGEPATFDRESETGALLDSRREIAVGEVEGELVLDGRRVRLHCRGTRTRTESGEAPESIVLARNLAAVFEDGTLLAAWGARPERAEGHGDEAMSAAIVEAGSDAEPIEELLLSTQYDDGGRHRRATLEALLPPLPAEGEPESETPDEDAQPPPPPPRLLRGAGVLLCGTTIDLGTWQASTAFFRWSVDGRAGLGRYDVTRLVSAR